MIIEQKQKAPAPTPAKRGRKAKSTTTKGKRGDYRGDMEISPNGITIRRHSNNTPYSMDKDNAVRITLELIQEGYSIPEICEKAKISWKCLRGWIAANKKGIGGAYVQAREVRGDRLALEIQRIADNADDSNPNAVAKARLQTDVRKWYLSHVLPEKYGELQRLELTGKGGAPLQVHSIGAAAIADAERLRAMLFGGASVNSSAPEVIDADVIDE